MCCIEASGIHVHVVSCSDPTQLTERRRSLVSQVQILGLASEAWSGQSNHRAAFIGIMQKREQVLQSYAQSEISLSNTEQLVILH